MFLRKGERYIKQWTRHIKLSKKISTLHYQKILKKYIVYPFEKKSLYSRPHFCKVEVSMLEKIYVIYLVTPLKDLCNPLYMETLLDALHRCKVDYE